MRNARVTGLLVLAAVGLASVAAAQGSRSVTFDAIRPGTAPTAFDCDVTGPGGPGRWLVTQALAEGGVRRVLAQTSQVASPDRLPHCLLRNYRGADVDVVVLIRPVSGTRAEAGGIAWRVQDRQNYYAVLVDGRAGEMAVLRVERGRAASLPLAGEDRKFSHRVRIERDRWYQLRLRATGVRFEVFLDGAKRFEVEDSAFRAAGAVGLVTLADSVVQFDAFNVAPAR